MHITFKTLALKQLGVPSIPFDPKAPTYSLSMLRSVLLLKGIAQLMPTSVPFHEFAIRAIEDRKVSAPGAFSALINQILEYFYFDRKILQLSHGFTQTGGHQYWFDAVRDPITKQPVIFLKSGTIEGEPEVLQLARLEPGPGNIHHIYNLLKRLRVPEINLQEIVDSVASNRSLVTSLTEYTQKVHHAGSEAMGVLEVFLLLGQEQFKEWVLNELVQRSGDLVPPQADQFSYPPFNLSFLPGFHALNGPGLIEAIYILGFLGLADDINFPPANEFSGLF